MAKSFWCDSSAVIACLHHVEHLYWPTTKDSRTAGFLFVETSEQRRHEANMQMLSVLELSGCL